MEKSSATSRPCRPAPDLDCTTKVSCRTRARSRLTGWMGPVCPGRLRSIPRAPASSPGLQRSSSPRHSQAVACRWRCSEGVPKLRPKSRPEAKPRSKGRSRQEAPEVGPRASPDTRAVVAANNRSLRRAEGLVGRRTSVSNREVAAASAAGASGQSLSEYSKLSVSKETLVYSLSFSLLRSLNRSRPKSSPSAPARKADGLARKAPRRWAQASRPRGPMVSHPLLA